MLCTIRIERKNISINAFLAFERNTNIEHRIFHSICNRDRDS